MYPFDALSELKYALTITVCLASSGVNVYELELADAIIWSSRNHLYSATCSPLGGSSEIESESFRCLMNWNM